jgi:hypothetical protein
VGLKDSANTQVAPVEFTGERFVSVVLLADGVAIGCWVITSRAWSLARSLSPGQT